MGVGAYSLETPDLAWNLSDRSHNNTLLSDKFPSHESKKNNIKIFFLKGFCSVNIDVRYRLKLEASQPLQTEAYVIQFSLTMHMRTQLIRTHCYDTIEDMEPT